MVEDRPSRPTPLIRRVFASGTLAAFLVFLVAFFTVPRLLAILEAGHFTDHDRATMYVAVDGGRGMFDLVGLRAPATLRQATFIGDGDKPSAPHGSEPTDRVRVLQRDDAGALMETVWSNDDYVITSRYRVAGQQVTPVSRKVFGVSQAMQGLLTAIVLAMAFKWSWTSRRRARVLEAA